ncbi:MAG TPA: hypothetical protein VNQ99_17615 [Xanthobacteraceae bacterium]|nr:hypothetical protein [Xanthobacteraceae bacterium]
MRDQVTIQLKKPLSSPAGPVNRIVMREPTFDEYLQIGDPQTVAMSAEGTPFVVENTEVIKQYFAVCLVEPKEVEVLSQASAYVAREVKQKFLGFFQPDTTEEEASETSPTSSSSEV